MGGWKNVWGLKKYFYKDGKVLQGAKFGIDFTYDTLPYWKTPEQMQLGTDKIEFCIAQAQYMQLCYSSLIDFSQWNKLYANITIEENTGGSYTPVYLIVSSDTHMDFAEGGIIKITQANASGIVYLDISDVNGFAYIRLQAQNHSTNASHRNKGYFSRIYATK